ncbi:type II toxin-antitoxin system VapC family toxin [Dyadobacter sp. CY343]|uniref:type II toxin-antitoxin system VapC family toxin n=1 Tax=Dyadobacter sp. CY343 TaxID=2907299 RepID=UPI001F1E5036|nr:type II toxin-antitoxin system VapC family toxin [Dyadobacter sp. CY343]MCE7059123.1 type II toxin-antitoxin system VapC family toxin [Dyadobacter sp. CY343]
MGERYLIDTSAVIKYLNGNFTAAALEYMDQILDDQCNISFVSEIELRVWNPANPSDKEVYDNFAVNSNVIGISQEVIDKTVQIRMSHRLKLPDAIIAATAIVNNLTLLADNDKDFLKVPDLSYQNPGKFVD